MKRPLHSILRVVLVFIPVLLALANVRAQGVDTVYVGDSTLITIVNEPGVEYYWELYDDVDSLNLAVVPGNCPPSEAYFMGGVDTGDSVVIKWLQPGI